MARDVVIVGAARTPIGAFQGALSSLTAPQLGAIAIKAALERAGVPPEKVDEVFMGCVLQAGVGQAPARQAAIFAGIPHGPRHHAEQGLRLRPQGGHLRRRRRSRCGDADVVVAGGMESMSNAPYLSPHDARRRPHGQRGVQGRDDPRRPLGRVRQRPHGHLRRAVRRRA